MSPISLSSRSVIPQSWTIAARSTGSVTQKRIGIVASAKPPQGNARAASTCPGRSRTSATLLDRLVNRGSSLSGIVTPVRLPPQKSPLPGEPGTHGAGRRTGLAVAIIEGVLVDEAEDVSAFLVRSHHELTVRRESAPELLVLIAGRV